MRRLGSAATALLSVLALGAGCSVAKEDDDRPEAADGELRLDHAADPQLFRAGDGMVLLAVRTDAEGAGAGIVSASYDGTWSAPEPLSARGTRTSTPQAALNDDGVGVATWTEQVPGDPALESSPPVVARIRQADGSWSPPATLDGFAYVEDVQVNARGERRRPRLSRRRPAPGRGAPGRRRVVVHRPPVVRRREHRRLDEDGGVHAALTSTERGGGGAVSTQYLPSGGTWTVPEPVATEPASSEPVRMLVLPDGGEVLLVGTASPNWQSTFDTQIYWSTALQVLRRDSREEPFEEAWTKDGATRVQGRVRGDTVEIAWLQESDGKDVDGAKGPVTVPSPGDPHGGCAGWPGGGAGQDPRRADGRRGTHGTIAFAAGSGCDGRAFVWRPVGVDDVPDGLSAQVSTDGRPQREPDGARRETPVVSGVQGALACAGGDEAWVARVEDAVRAGSADQDDLRLTDATIMVAPLD